MFKLHVVVSRSETGLFAHVIDFPSREAADTAFEQLKSTNVTDRQHYVLVTKLYAS